MARSRMPTTTFRRCFRHRSRNRWSRATGRRSTVRRNGRGGVADPAAAVADTHALIFHSAGGGQLGPKAKAHFTAAERREALVYVPVAVVWEVSLLARAVRINLHRPVRDFFTDLFSNPAYQPHDLAAAQVFAADELRFTRDPFDALICAAARDLSLPLITRGAAIASSRAVRVVW